MPWDSTAYGAAVRPLLAAAPRNPLGPGTPDAARRSQLAALSTEALCAPSPVASVQDAACCVSALWLRFNFLDESHELSQQIDTPAGSFWHAIMHRREPDYGNSKYWFRRVGRPDIFVPLAAAAREFARAMPHPAGASLQAAGAWDPFAFVDLCERAARDAALVPLCEAIQQREWELLFDHCYQRACGRA